MRCLKNCSEMMKPRRPFATVAREMSKFGRDKNTLVSSQLENYFVLRLREKINSKYQGFRTDFSAVRHVLVDFNERAH